MADLKGKTLFITGASRGIGLAIAMRAAKDGANIVVAAKTTEPHPKLPGTIYTAAEEIERAGGKALPVATDIRDEDQVVSAVEAAIERFGGIDILVNNASAISLTGTLETPMKRVDLMLTVNLRGTIDKYGMSMCVLGMAEEFRADGVAVNALWPRTTIATAALQIIPGADPSHGRTPEIMADAAHHILTRESRSRTGRFLIDEAVLREAGVSDFVRYAVKPGAPLHTDLFLDDPPRA